MVIAFAFHGVVKHKEQPIKGAIDALRELTYDHALVLVSTSSEPELYNEVKYLAGYGISLFGINIVPNQTISSINGSYYVNYEILIDPKAIGAPLVPEGYIDWIQVRKLLKNKLS